MAVEAEDMPVIVITATGRRSATAANRLAIHIRQLPRLVAFDGNLLRLLAKATPPGVSIELPYRDGEFLIGNLSPPANGSGLTLLT